MYVRSFVLICVWYMYLCVWVHSMYVGTCTCVSILCMCVYIHVYVFCVWMCGCAYVHVCLCVFIGICNASACVALDIETGQCPASAPLLYTSLLSWIFIVSILFKREFLNFDSLFPFPELEIELSTLSMLGSCFTTVLHSWNLFFKI